MYKSRMKRLEERMDALEKRPVSQPVKIEVTCKGMSVGEIIRSRRENIGMSQKDLASAIGISVPMICQIERGSKIPSLILGRDIARVFQCKIDDLVGSKEEMDV